MYLKHNTLGDDIPIGIVFKAMGIESDQEVVQLVGTEFGMPSRYAPSLEEPVRERIYTQRQALRFIGAKIRANQRPGMGYNNKTPEDEAREVSCGFLDGARPSLSVIFLHSGLYICIVDGYIGASECCPVARSYGRF